MYTVDTNILIYHTNGERRVVDFFLTETKKGSQFLLPTIVVVELFSYPAITPAARRILESLLPYFRIVPLDQEISFAAAELKANTGIKLADSIIVATALNTHSTLVTRNVRDFNKIPNLRLLAF